MDSRQRGLLDAVLANRAADEPREVYADLLEEMGDPRGEFIRAQLDLRRGVSPARRITLKKRVAALLSEHRSTWSAPASETNSHAFVRGFIQRVAAGADFIANHRALTDVEPLERLDLTIDGDEDLFRLVNSGLLGKLTGLQIRGQISDATAIGYVLTSPDLMALTNLNLGGTGLPEEAVQILAASPHAANLQTLSLTGNPIEDEGVRQLAQSDHLRPRRLFLADTGITDDGVDALVASSLLDRVVRLGLQRNEIEEAQDRIVERIPKTELSLDYY